MNKRPSLQKSSMLLLLFLITSVVSLAQQPQLPKGVTQNQKPIIPVKPLVKKDTVRYVAVTPTITASSTFATADELYIQQGTFILRSANDYRYLTIKDPAPATGSIAFLWRHTDNRAQQVWKFVPQPGGFYRIRSESGLYLTQKRALVPTMDPQINEDSQLWQLTETSDGFYTIKSKTNKYLVVADTRKRDGTLVGFANTVTNEPKHKWHLIKWSDETTRKTSFVPEVNGFHFVNTFNGEDIIRWGGLCGGMVYSALDYFRVRIPVPTQTYTPANATVLQSYLYQRQQHSMWNVNEKWSELEVAYNTRGSEIYRWGIQGTGGGRLEELKNSIDAGNSTPIGLFVGGIRGLDNSDNGNHVILAVGYSTGRYRGDLGGHINDYKILAYDPNMRNRTVTLVPDILGERYFEIESGKAWRTYFVNNHWDKEHAPPRNIPNFPEAEPEGSIRHLYAEFWTGGDDLRGKNDNVGITVNYADGTEQHFGNVNGLVRWVDNSTQTVHLELNRTVRKSDIRSFTITTTFGDGFDSDDWNLDAFIVTTGLGGITFAYSAANPGSYIFRFSGDEHRQKHTIMVE
ncbi:MAG TPA: RICIN domain-containing protein [Chitinophagaceae bacterium]|jgi:hypothetical protein|nr:RICIN domain-containing protein [Chitinophagaceae bacterium]